MKIPLIGGFYQARSLIANAQRAVNLYPERNPEDAPFPFTHYLTPGLTLFGTSPFTRVVRGLYRSTTGVLFAVIGQNLYQVSSGGVFIDLGLLNAALTTPVSMVDNGMCLVLVDGSTDGYVLNLADNTFGQISSAAFYGATRVDYVDTYFIFNRPGTNQWYISVSNATYAAFTAGGVAGGTVTTAGSGYPNGTFTNLTIIDGPGSGVMGTAVTAGGSLVSFTPTTPGTGYNIGDVLIIQVNRAPSSVSINTAGTEYVAGTYTINAVGGSGVGLSLKVVLSSTLGLTAVSIVNPGSGYNNGELVGLPATLQSSMGTPAQVKITGIMSGDNAQFTVNSVVSTGFDPLDIASKTGYADPIQTIAVMHREIWLIGELTTEVWYDTGASDFTFGIMPGVFIEHGCVAPYSLAKQDLNLFWLSQDLQGQALVVMGASYQSLRISTHAIEQVIQGYATVTDAVGFTYQQDGHVFYQLTFPSANATWVYDVSTELWHQRASTDDNGDLNRHRANCAANCYGLNICGDYQNGLLYTFDLNNYTDNGFVIPRIRSFPHLQNEDKRVNYRLFIADMEVGTAVGTTTDDPPLVSLRWSDTRGASWSNPVEQPLGAAGQYLTSVMWPRLGMARDRIFELSWSAGIKTALNGAYIDQVLMGS